MTRKIFDNIISNNNLVPESNTEYIYRLDMIWQSGSHESIDCDMNMIVENVEQEESGDYSFNIKGHSTRYRCTYGWAFVKNTDENLEILNEISKLEAEIAKCRLKINEYKIGLDGLFDYAKDENVKLEK